MQFPIMSPGVPSHITYAMVGAVIGHEVSHAFDDQGFFNNLSAHGYRKSLFQFNATNYSGGRFDEFGNLHNWWDVDTARKFYEKTECFIEQYNAVKVEEAGAHLNGELSVGENIADNAGVKTALIVRDLSIATISKRVIVSFSAA